jgi:hypothetical protein
VVAAAAGIAPTVAAASADSAAAPANAESRGKDLEIFIEHSSFGEKWIRRCG